MKKKSKFLQQLILGIVLALFSHWTNAQETLVKFKDVNGNYGFKNKSGTIVIPAKYQNAPYFKDGLAAIKQNNKWGFIDEQGREIIPPKYDEAGYDYGNIKSFRDGLAPVALSGKWGYIDKNGKVIVPIKYQVVEEYTEGMAAVQLNGKWGFVDKTGREVISPRYDHYEPLDPEGYDYFGYFFSDGMAAVYLKGRYGFIDKKGKEVVPIKYYNVEPFKNGFAGVTINRKWGFVDKTGKEVIPIKYETVHDFTEGMAAVEMNKKWGFVNGTGQEVVPVKYNYVRDFSEGLAAVGLNDNWGFVDKTGKEVIPLQFSYVNTSFKNGKASITNTDKKILLIDKTGKPIEKNSVLPQNSNTETKTSGSNKNEPVTPEIPPPTITLPANLPKPPAIMKGGIDASIKGLWTATYPNGIKVYFEFKGDGTYIFYTGDYTPANAYNHKCYWRIDGAFMETFCAGATQVDRNALKKGYDTAKKPTLKINEIVFFPADTRISW